MMSCIQDTYHKDLKIIFRMEVEAAANQEESTQYIKDIKKAINTMNYIIPFNKPYLIIVKSNIFEAHSCAQLR